MSINDTDVVEPIHDVSMLKSLPEEISKMATVTSVQTFLKEQSAFV